MPQTAWGPVNITQGNSAFFTAEFYDANGLLTIPAGANVQISYIDINNTSQTTTIALALTNNFYTGTWSTALASLGLATWNLFATGNSTAQQTGQIRVIEIIRSL